MISRIEMVVLVGPTAVGKTAVAVELALRLDGEIVSADSMQVYRGLDLLAAKPSPEERARVPHHLIDVLDPRERCDVARYLLLARASVGGIWARRRLPIVVGGAGMYVRALIDGIFQGAGRDASVRDRLEREAENSGAAALHARLKRVDPPTALRIHPNDKRRIIRALEVYELSGRPISSFHNEWEPGGGGASGGNGISMSRNLGCAFAYAGLRRRKEDLASRIEGRVERMFREGAIEEVRKLLPRRGELPETMWQSLGLKEIIGSLEGRYGLDEAKRLLLKRTRAYAKRQYTWFNRDKRITWFDITPDESADRTAERIMSSMEVIRA